MVYLIERHARIATDPLFGGIRDVVPKRDIKGHKPPSSKSAHGYKGSSFATITTSPRVSDGQKPFQNAKSDHKTINVHKLCVFCAGEYAPETCKMNEKSYKEKIDCLKVQGICFCCLTKGHLSKDCHKRMKCEVCSLKHPTILHIYKKRSEHKNNSDKDTQTASVISALVSLKGSNHTEAGGQQTLPIIPVQVKLSNSNTTVQTYAFMDQGSTSAFALKLFNNN